MKSAHQNVVVACSLGQEVMELVSMETDPLAEEDEA